MELTYFEFFDSNTDSDQSRVRDTVYSVSVFHKTFNTTKGSCGLEAGQLNGNQTKEIGLQ
jgi:hypothetical protein